MPWAAANGLLMPPLLPAIWGGTTTASVIDATGEKVAWVGRVWNKDHGLSELAKAQSAPISFIRGYDGKIIGAQKEVAP